MPRLRRTVAKLSSRRVGFDLKSVLVRFVVSEMSVSQFSVPRLPFSPVSIIPPKLHTLILIYMLPLAEAKAGETPEVSTSNILSEIGKDKRTVGLLSLSS